MYKLGHVIKNRIQTPEGPFKNRKVSISRKLGEFCVNMQYLNYSNGTSFQKGVPVKQDSKLKWLSERFLSSQPFNP